MHLLQKKWGGREAQDGEHMYTHGWLMWMYGKNHKNKQTNINMAWWNFRVFGEGCFGWVCSTHRGPNGDWERTRYFEKRSPSPATGIFPWASPAPRLVAPVLKHRLLGAQGHGWCLAWSRFPRHHLDTGRRHLLMLSIPPLALASLSF